jgi:HPt (histidine-containing phosphotransfer) domain-containing protein
MSTKKIIDLTYLNGIANGSDDFIKKMLLLFLEQTPTAVNNLEKHLNNKDWKSLQFTAHKLKASFVFMGVKELPDIISSVEECAANEINLNLLPGMILKIKDVTNLVMKELEMERKTLI